LLDLRATPVDAAESSLSARGHPKLNGHSEDNDAKPIAASITVISETIFAR
jgi:hypothetical protein